MSAPSSRSTRLIHAGQPPLSGRTAPVNIPTVRTSTLRFESSQTYHELSVQRDAGQAVASYGRHGLDTHRALERAIAELEQGRRSFLTPSGLSAITLVFLALLAPGDHAVLSDGVYAPVRKFERQLLARLGIAVTYFDPLNTPLDSVLQPNTRLLYLESPGSLLFEICDLPALARQAQARGVLVAADNTWASGWLHQPLALGADLSVLAATKYVCGHSDAMMGAVTVKDDALARRLAQTYDALGMSVGADDAYLVLRGLRTLGVRLAQHQRHALDVAAWLERHPAVDEVFCPALPGSPDHALWQRDFSGGNGLLSFALKGRGVADAHAFVDTLKLFGIGASWGGFESLALTAAPERLAGRARWQSGQGVVRLHIGLEDPADLIADLQQAFEQLSSQPARTTP